MELGFVLLSMNVKPVALVAGRPFLQHLLDYWITQGINEFILLVGYKYQQIFDYLVIPTLLPGFITKLKVVL